MNRIRELRTLAGMTIEELAARAETSGAQISRLEQGARRLTDEWMKRLCEALECAPTDLMAYAVVDETANEVEPAIDILPAIAAAISKRGLTAYRVTGSCLSDAGVLPGDVRTFDESPAAIQAAKAGDVVLVQLHEPPVLVLRQFLPPHVLCTNKSGQQLAFRTDDKSIRCTVRGVMVVD